MKRRSVFERNQKRADDMVNNMPDPIRGVFDPSFDSDAPSIVKAREKSKAKAALVWELRLPKMWIRCIRSDEDFVIQGKTYKGWSEEIGRGPDALALLRKAVAGNATARAFELR